MAFNKSSQGSIKPTIIAHGGAWNIPDSLRAGHLNGVSKAVKTGYQILIKNGSAVEAVEKAVASMEDDPIFDAGVGSFLNEEGYVELDALIMDGKTLNAGAIGAVSNCRNPIVLARRLLEKENSPMMLVGLGANLFAEKMRLNCDPKDAVLIKNPEDYRLPKFGLATTYIIAKHDFYFVYPNRYNEFVKQFQNSFQHGGISLDEIVVPISILTPK